LPIGEDELRHALPATCKRFFAILSFQHLIAHAHRNLAADLADNTAVIDYQAKLRLRLPRLIYVSHSLCRADDRIYTIPTLDILLLYDRINFLARIRA